MKSTLRKHILAGIDSFLQEFKLNDRDLSHLKQTLEGMTPANSRSYSYCNLVLWPAIFKTLGTYTGYASRTEHRTFDDAQVERILERYVLAGVGTVNDLVFYIDTGEHTIVHKNNARYITAKFEELKEKVAFTVIVETKRKGEVEDSILYLLARFGFLVAAYQGTRGWKNDDATVFLFSPVLEDDE